MNFLLKISAFSLAVCGGVLLAQHAIRATNAALPSDMPRDAHFLASGFDIATSEAQGNWIACRVNPEQATDWCRVTDQKGSVVFQGDYLPADSPIAVSADELQVANVRPDRIWVRGPVEQGPVPVIALTNGKVLVPAADREALDQRWSLDPAELNRVSGQ